MTTSARLLLGRAKCEPKLQEVDSCCSVGCLRAFSLMNWAASSVMGFQLSFKREHCGDMDLVNVERFSQSFNRMRGNTEEKEVGLYRFVKVSFLLSCILLLVPFQENELLAPPKKRKRVAKEEEAIKKRKKKRKE